MRHVSFLDTTLRDGIKIAGICLTDGEKLQLGSQIAGLGVDVFEIGFPAASEDQYRSACTLAESIEGPTLSVLARATNAEDFTVARDVLKRTSRSRIHTFLPVSPQYREHYLKRPLDAILGLAEEAVLRAKENAKEVEFSLVDAFRSTTDDIFRLAERALSAGAAIVNLADTVGCATPWHVEDLIGQLRKRFGDTIRWSIHCHNDLGLAVVNSLAAVKAGATQLHCTINGLGERAGNAPLEEIATILLIYGQQFGLTHSIVTHRLGPVCHLVERFTGISMSPLKPLVGRHAFACDLSTPQLGDATERPPFFVVPPREIGIPLTDEPLDRDTDFSSFTKYLSHTGYTLSEENARKAYEMFLDIAAKKDQLFLQDIELIVHRTLFDVEQRYKLLYLNVSAGSIPVPHATVQLEIDGQILQDAGFGQGPVDATFKTIFRMVRRFPRLLRYEVKAATTGTDAQGQVLLRLQEDDTIVDGRGFHTDIVLASAMALIDALNKFEHHRGKREVSELTDDESWSVRL